MTAEQHIKAGQLTEALAALQQEIRAKPEDVRLRVFLFQLNCILGRWDKALAQLQALSSLGADTMLLAQVFRPLIACEMLRREVFAGRRMPLVFGEPMEWMGWLLQANILVAEGKFTAAAELRGRALEAAPAAPGQVGGHPFAWLADADSRLGPVLEAMIDGRYYWIPLCRIREIQIEKPVDLRDLVWLPSAFTWTNGGNALGHIPVRYAGTEETEDDGLRLAHRTTWQEKPNETFLGLGQRLLATDHGEYPLLECRSLRMDEVKE